MIDTAAIIDLTKEIANHIKTQRLRNRWSRDELAERSQVNVFTLKHFERSGQVSLERFLKLCDALGMLDDFVRAIKPRERVDIDQWRAPEQPLRQRGRRIGDDEENNNQPSQQPNQPGDAGIF